MLFRSLGIVTYSPLPSISCAWDLLRFLDLWVYSFHEIWNFSAIISSFFFWCGFFIYPFLPIYPFLEWGWASTMATSTEQVGKHALQAMQEKKALSSRGRGRLRGFLRLRLPWGFSQRKAMPRNAQTTAQLHSPSKSLPTMALLPTPRSPACLLRAETGPRIGRPGRVWVTGSF